MGIRTTPLLISKIYLKGAVDLLLNQLVFAGLVVIYRTWDAVRQTWSHWVRDPPILEGALLLMPLYK